VRKIAGCPVRATERNLQSVITRVGRPPPKRRHGVDSADVLSLDVVADVKRSVRTVYVGQVPVDGAVGSEVYFPLRRQTRDEHAKAVTLHVERVDRQQNSAAVFINCCGLAVPYFGHIVGYLIVQSDGACRGAQS